MARAPRNPARRPVKKAARAVALLPESHPAPLLLRSTGDTSDLSEDIQRPLPEPTTYTGFNHVPLGIPADFFRFGVPLLQFDGEGTFVDCGNPAHLRGGTNDALTIEAWIRPESVDGLRHIVSHGQTRLPDAEVWLRINNGWYEFGIWTGKVAMARAQVPPGDIGTWVHLAGVFDKGRYALYRNGIGMNAVVNAPPPPRVDASWYIGAQRDMDTELEGAEKKAAQDVKDTDRRRIQLDEKATKALAALKKAKEKASIVRILHPALARAIENEAREENDGAKKASTAARLAHRAALAQQARIARLIADKSRAPLYTMQRFFQGAIAEVRLWNIARKIDQIAAAMTATTLQVPTGELAAWWRLNEGQGTVCLDTSGRDGQGRIGGEGQWVAGPSPVGEALQVNRRQPPDRVATAFAAAKTRGIFDPLVFPRVRTLLLEPERVATVAALRDLTIETFKAFYEAGHHLVFQSGLSGALSYTFVPTPPLQSRPRLVLIEEYRLSTFVGAYGLGRTLKTFSLLPGETTQLSIRTSSRSETVARQASSILDSYSQESAQEFEQALSQEQSNRASQESSASARASAEASGSWAFGSASASMEVQGSTSDAREEFAKSVSTATSKHAARASANRNVQIETNTQTTTTEEQQTEIVRQIRNINVGHTLNFVFTQMNQEFISLLHLVDVRIGYSAGVEPLRQVPLPMLDELLEEVLVADEDKRAEVRRFVLDELAQIRDYLGVARSDVVRPVSDEPDEFRYRLDQELVSRYTHPTTGTERAVPGIIIAASSMVMRTEDVLVESVIGKRAALDDYAVRLQEEEIRSRQLANERQEMDNRLLALQAERHALLLELVRNRETDLLALFTQAVRA